MQGKVQETSALGKRYTENNPIYPSRARKLGTEDEKKKKKKPYYFDSEGNFRGNEDEDDIDESFSFSDFEQSLYHDYNYFFDKAYTQPLFRKTRSGLRFHMMVEAALPTYLFLMAIITTYG